MQVFASSAWKLGRNVSAWKISVRYLTSRKRFYKNVSIVKDEDQFAICLDHRKLKTPHAKPFYLRSEPLALAIATEWNSQRDIIRQHSMHLTALSNSVLDNPMQRDADSLVNDILNYLESDTVCVRDTEPHDLVQLHKVKWDPILAWFNKRYELNVQPTNDIVGLKIEKSSLDIMRKHLLSYNIWALTGFYFAVETVKSLLLTMAVVDRFVSIEDAVSLSRLETEFQIKYWGNVEWAHDVDLMDTRARLAAAVLFIHLNSESNSVRKRTAKS